MYFKCTDKISTICSGVQWKCARAQFLLFQISTFDKLQFPHSLIVIWKLPSLPFPPLYFYPLTTITPRWTQTRIEHDDQHFRVVSWMWLPVGGCNCNWSPNMLWGEYKMLSPASRLTTCLMYVGWSSDWHEFENTRKEVQGRCQGAIFHFLNFDFWQVKIPTRTHYHMEISSLPLSPLYFYPLTTYNVKTNMD